MQLASREWYARLRIGPLRGAGLCGAAALAVHLMSGAAQAQTLGIATMTPGSLNHTTASAIARVLKEKAGLNVLVQPTAGESVIIPLTSRGEADIGIANSLEVRVAVAESKLSNLRLIGAIHPLPTAFFVRKSTPLRTIADLKGKKVVYGFSAQRTIDIVMRAILATSGLTPADVSQVLVPNVVRGADDFVAGGVDAFYFAFGAPKVREVDATVGGIRALAIPEAGMEAARKVFADGYLAPAVPNPFFIGVEKPMGVYTWDNLLFTNATVKDDIVYKVIDAIVKNKADLVTIQPALRALTAAGLHISHSVPYHPGAVKYFSDNKIGIRGAR
ncbi:MAG: TAXI family TRAP transporter solute-binding subunit [Rhizobiales bacterium]|nr:TAXI family TRAP transporter solute-binding subunit [Hyphomicrobiales bacterium]